MHDPPHCVIESDNPKCHWISAGLNFQHESGISMCGPLTLNLSAVGTEGATDTSSY